MCGCLLCAPYWGLARNPGVCPDWESNWRPLVHRPALSPLSHTSQGVKPSSVDLEMSKYIMLITKLL